MWRTDGGFGTRGFRAKDRIALYNLDPSTGGDPRIATFTFAGDTTVLVGAGEDRVRLRVVYEDCPRVCGGSNRASTRLFGRLAARTLARPSSRRALARPTSPPPRGLPMRFPTVRLALAATLLATFSTALFVTGCDSGDATPDDTTVQQDIANIEATIDELVAAGTALNGGPLSVALKSFLKLSNGEADADWAEDVVTELDDVLDIDVENDRRFNFSANTGVYVWSRTSRTWARTGPSSDVVLQFPSAEAQTTNNATLTLRGYRDTPVTIDGEAYGLPSALTLDVTVGGTRVFAVNLQNAAYDTTSDILVPTAVTAEVFTAPQTHTVAYTRSTPTDFALTYRLVGANDAPVVNLTAAVKLASADYDEIEAEDVVRVSGTLATGTDLSTAFNIQAGQIAALDDPTEAQINALVSAVVSFDGAEIGTLEYDEPTEDVFIVYKDGTSGSTARYYDALVDRLEAVFDDYVEGQNRPFAGLLGGR